MKINLSKLFLVIGIFFAILLSISFISAYCAELATFGASCQNVPQSQCATGTNPQTGQPYRCDPNSCNSTDYCMTGTCVNTVTGQCLSGEATTCIPANNGIYYSDKKDNVKACQMGCCLYGEQASFTTSAGCDILSSAAGVSPNFDTSVTDGNTCSSMAFPQEEGACVYETNSGRTCLLTTKQECSKRTDTHTFYGGFLCTNPALGTNCKATTETTCLSSESQVYFTDTCGNHANVYDANKIYSKNVNYWSFLASSTIGAQNGVQVDVGDGKGNKGSTTNGNCNYLLGSVCSAYDQSIDGLKPSLMGSNICRDVDCKLGTYADLFKNSIGNGRAPYNGESWCGKATATGITVTSGNPGVSSTSFSSYSKAGNNPGETEVLFRCMNGEITTEISATYRNKVCLQAQDSNGNFGAQFYVNRWQDCYFQNSSKNCLDNTTRDCQWITGASILKDPSGNGLVWDKEKDLLVPMVDNEGFGVLGNQPDGKDDEGRQEASCVPRYPPGFDPSTSGTATDTSPQTICGYANRVCYVNYSRGIINALGLGDDWTVQGSITCLTNDPHGSETESVDSDWNTSMQNMCSAIGDCGISVNYVGTTGSNTWSDLFKIITGKWSGGSNV